jgi:hypothetical protein
MILLSLRTQQSLFHKDNFLMTNKLPYFILNIKNKILIKFNNSVKRDKKLSIYLIDFSFYFIIVSC